MLTVLMLEEIMKMIHAYGLQRGRTMAKKQRFYDELECEWNLRSNDEWF